MKMIPQINSLCLNLEDKRVAHVKSHTFLTFCLFAPQTNCTQTCTSETSYQWTNREIYYAAHWSSSVSIRPEVLLGAVNEQEMRTEYKALRQVTYNLVTLAEF